jgi:uracil-DNA glycosylase
VFVVQSAHMATEVAWSTVQQRIWECEACRGHRRVEVNVRQQTGGPERDTALLFIGVAPPDQGSPCGRTRAKSAINDPGDNLRHFIERATALQWEGLISSGAFLIHAVKCAIVADEDGFQNPPNDVVDRCCPIGFNDELRLLRPARIVALGGAARRAVLKHPSVTTPLGIGVSKTFKQLEESWPQGIRCHLANSEFTLHSAPFPRSATAKRKAAAILREAVRLAGLGNAAG